jgi:hypothetical protein
VLYQWPGWYLALTPRQWALERCDVGIAGRRLWRIWAGVSRRFPYVYLYGKRDA